MKRNMFIHINIHLYTHTFIHTYFIRTYTYTFIHTYIHTLIVKRRMFMGSAHCDQNHASILKLFSERKTKKKLYYTQKGVKRYVAKPLGCLKKKAKIMHQF